MGKSFHAPETMNTDALIADKLLSVARLWGEASDMIYSGVRKDGDRAWFHMAGYEVLNHIDNGITTTKKLAAEVNSTMANITHMTKALEESGCIRREVNKTDKRVWNFHTTSKGRNLLRVVRLQHVAAIGHFCSQFTEDQKMCVLTFLSAIETHLVQFVRIPEGERMKMLQQHQSPELAAHFSSMQASGKRSASSRRRRLVGKRGVDRA